MKSSYWLTPVVAGVLALGMVALLYSAFIDCGSPHPQPTLQPCFVQGQMVDLRLGGEAQVLRTYRCDEGPGYLLRIQTWEGLQTIRVDEFELCLPGGTYRE